MPEPPESTARRAHAYSHQTRRPLNNLAMLAPLLVIFHLGAAVYGTDLLLLAPTYLRQFMHYLGAPALMTIPAAAVCIVLLAQQIAQREKWTVQPQALAGMFGESVLWTIPLIGISHLTGRIGAANVLGGRWDGIAQRVLISLGAGIYEEFIFRMILISLILLLLVDVFELKKDPMTVLAVLLAAAVFSLCHFTILGGAEAFAPGKFIFLCIAGILWGGLYLYRGLGIAAGTHVVWDIYVLLAAPAHGVTAFSIGN